jgi:hypothetical protein
VGKTYVAVALMRGKISGDNEAIFTHPNGVTTVHVPAYPRIDFGPGSAPGNPGVLQRPDERGEMGLIEKYAGSRCLIMDDLGVEKTSKWSMQALYSIIDRRYRDERQTLVTSNLTLNEIAEKVGDRIASRIAGMCKVVEIKGADRRLN